MIPTTADDATLERYVTNLTDAWINCTEDQLERGRQWYPVAHQLALVVGEGDARKGAGVIAALSVQKKWEHNVALATDAGNGFVHGHMESALAKVRAILGGADPEDILPMAAKTGHFFRNIADPSDPDPVTVDRHAHDVAVGERYGNSDRGLSNKTRYATLALAYRLGARRALVIPSVFQATLWGWQIDQNEGEKSDA
jgi:hypothetical protein